MFQPIKSESILSGRNSPLSCTRRLITMQVYIRLGFGFKYNISADLFSLFIRPHAGLVTVQSSSTEFGTNTLNLRKQQVNTVSLHTNLGTFCYGTITQRLGK